MKSTYLLLFSLSIAGVCFSQEKIETGIGHSKKISLYSKNVQDSFFIFVNLPNGYNPQKKRKYPVVYLLDANIYFDIMAAALDKYSEIGLAPSVILVGIGYKDFPTLDSLRNRDDTYPVAIPEYEMSISGGADKFLSFISQELIPRIDEEYKTDTSGRVLMGHSLGGYFVGYSLFRDLSGKSYTFNSYIAASPSIHYNKYYLLDQLKKLPVQKGRSRKIKTYITFGGQENDENKDDSTMFSLDKVSMRLKTLLAIKQSGCITYKADIYSDLGHMDTQIPTFIKGLRWALVENKETK